MRQYRGEFKEAYALLESWGHWHWVNRERSAGLGFPTMTGFYRVGHGNPGGMEFDLPVMDERQALAERLVRCCCTEAQMKLAKVIFCDMPCDEWQAVARRVGVSATVLLGRRDTLLATLHGALRLEAA